MSPAYAGVSAGSSGTSPSKAGALLAPSGSSGVSPSAGGGYGAF